MTIVILGNIFVHNERIAILSLKNSTNSKEMMGVQEMKTKDCGRKTLKPDITQPRV